MEITKIGFDSLKIKGKNSILVVDPNNTVKSKTIADAVLLLKDRVKYDLSKIEDSRLLISGSGEYEIAGTKITAFYLNESLFYYLEVDGLQILLTTTEAMPNLKEPMKDYNLIILNVNKIIDESLITVLVPRVAVLYGEKSKEFAKVLGSQKEAELKFSVKKEQIPEEMEVVVIE